MNILEILRFIFISFETLIMVILLAVLHHSPELFENIGAQLITDKEVWKFLPTIPLIICGFSIKYAWKILMPLDNTSNRILHEWPGYWKLKYRVLFSVLVNTICVLSTIIIWIFSSKLPLIIVGAIFIASCIIPLTVAFNQLLAAFKVRELMEP